MFSVNRSTLIIRPRQALFNWVNKIYPDTPLSMDNLKEHDDADVFLIPDFFSIEDAEEWLEENMDYFFDYLLNEWCEDEEQWPKSNKRTWKLFQDFFDYNFQTIVRDIVEEPLERLSEEFLDDPEVQEEMLNQLAELFEQEDQGIPIQLKIELPYTNPAIWRRIQVGENATFQDLHFAIQMAMGWTNAHLHEFKIQDRLIGMDIPGGFDKPENQENEKDVRLKDLHLQPGDTFTYLYDFGDSWQHNITVEPIKQAAKELPKVIDGAIMGPPEDIGGFGGLEALQIALFKPNHPEYKDYRSHFMLDEYDDDEPFYDPEDWSVEAANEALKGIPLLKLIQDRGMDMM